MVFLFIMGNVFSIITIKNESIHGETKVLNMPIKGTQVTLFLFDAH